MEILALIRVPCSEVCFYSAYLVCPRMLQSARTRKHGQSTWVSVAGCFFHRARRPRKPRPKELASIWPIWFHSLSLSTAHFEDLNMDHFRKSMDPVEMFVRDSEIDKRRDQQRNDATKSIMTWIQGVSEGLFRIWPRFAEKLGHAGI